MTARGLSLSRREPGAGATRRHASRRSVVAFFGTQDTALYYRCSLDPAAMAALGGQDSRDAGLPSVGAVANRSGDATPCSALQDRLRWAPLMSKAEGTYK